MSPVPSRSIILWSGAIVDIPSGYQLCDGTNGTPNLRNLFVIGAGDTYNPGDSAGSAGHSHTFTTTPHTHTLPAGSAIASGSGFLSQTAGTPVSGSTNPTASIPPYYALAYIMRMP